MGTFFVDMEIGDQAGQRWISVEALVDTGASTCSVPSSLLTELGVSPTRRKRYKIGAPPPGSGTGGAVGQGETRAMGVGQTYIRLTGSNCAYAGEEFITDFIFNEENSMPLLGALALESAHLGVDPHGERLVPEDGLLM